MNISLFTDVILREFGDSTLTLKANGDFTLIILTLRFYPRFFQRTLRLLLLCNTVGTG